MFEQQNIIHTDTNGKVIPLTVSIGVVTRALARMKWKQLSSTRMKPCIRQKPLAGIAYHETLPYG